MSHVSILRSETLNFRGWHAQVQLHRSRAFNPANDSEKLFSASWTLTQAENGSWRDVDVRSFGFVIGSWQQPEGSGERGLRRSNVTSPTCTWRRDSKTKTHKCTTTTLLQCTCIEFERGAAYCKLRRVQFCPLGTWATFESFQKHLYKDAFRRKLLHFTINVSNSKSHKS